MSRSVLSRLVCGLLVTILSALPLAAAEPAGPAAPRAEGFAAGLSSLWSWLAKIWSENGCYIDPHGSCHASVSGTPSAPDHLDGGCYIDPHGGCNG